MFKLVRLNGVLLCVSSSVALGLLLGGGDVVLSNVVPSGVAVGVAMRDSRGMAVLDKDHAWRCGDEVLGLGLVLG